MWASFPVPRFSGPKFINAVAKCTTSNNFNPNKIMEILKKIESKMGRKINVINSPRIIDLDLLDFNSINIDGELVLPHPRLHIRRFVLEPLLEVEPNWKHPITGENIGRMLSQLRDNWSVNKVKNTNA